MARAPVRVEQFVATAHAVGLCRWSDPIADLAEDHPLPRIVHLPQPGEMAVLPSVSVQLTHRGLVLVAREEGERIGRRPPEGEERVMGSVREVVPANEAR